MKNGTEGTQKTHIENLKPGVRKYIEHKSDAELQFNLLDLFENNKENYLKQWQINANERVEKSWIKLVNLGFNDRALEDLKKIASDDSKPYMKRIACLKLALWYAQNPSNENNNNILQFINDAKNGMKESEQLRAAKILEAEIYQQIGNVKLAKQILTEPIYNSEHIDYYFSYANLETSPYRKVRWLNKAYQDYNLSRVYYEEDYTGDSVFHKLKVNSRTTFWDSDSKVSIIVPLENESDNIYSIGSILSQTWANIEILIIGVEDSEIMNKIIKLYIDKDNRIKLVNCQNDDSYYSKVNLGLKVATGKFVTIHELDTWRHPQMIEKHVNHLLENTEIIGNISDGVYIDNNFRFIRTKFSGSYLMLNLKSFLFRREASLMYAGFWDNVRYGSNIEYIERLKAIFGRESIASMSAGPLVLKAIVGIKANERIEKEETGLMSGALREYYEAFHYFHQNSNNIFINHSKDRAFPIPELLSPETTKLNSKQHFDVIIASDFRLVGGSTLSNVEEIKAQKTKGLRTGLIQMSRYDFSPRRTVQASVRELIDGDIVQMLVHGEDVSCDVLIIRYPPVLQEWQSVIPCVHPAEVKVIINQPPMSDYGPKGVIRYNLDRSEKHLKRYFGKAGIWHPIGPLVRDALYKYHKEELQYINLAKEDWSNIIDLEKWRRNSQYHPRRVPWIGRHSRDHEVKWPSDPKELLSIYPASTDYEVHVLGGGKTPEKVLGEIPTNWNIIEFGEISPRDFLATLDIFVYYTHPDWVEAFGRVIIEAMAVGVPVILPPHYCELFGEAAIYAEPYEVKGKIAELINNVDYYRAQVEKATLYVKDNFSYEKHLYRLKEEI